MTQDDISGPFAATLDPLSGAVDPEATTGGRTLADMADLFLDSAGALVRAQKEDVVIYSTSTAPVPHGEGHLGFNQTRIEPGDVSGELFMTHGHAHERLEGETYIGQSGEGGIILSKGGEVVWVPMRPGVLGYIPPGWTHRSVNTGNTPFVFISVYPALSGQDYGFVKRNGLGARVLRTGSSGYRVNTDTGDTIHSA